ncbi:hypothetical protein ECO9389_17378, partial [Escherichia coli O157:H- str. 493-89]
HIVFTSPQIRYVKIAPGIQIQLPSLIRYRGTRQFLQSAKLAIGQT